MTHWIDSLTYSQLFALAVALGIGFVVLVVIAVYVWTGIEWWWHTRRGERWVWDLGPLARHGPDTSFLRPGHWRGHWEKT